VAPQTLQVIMLNPTTGTLLLLRRNDCTPERFSALTIYLAVQRVIERWQVCRPINLQSR
jgi:hypothetical protein